MTRRLLAEAEELERLAARSRIEYYGRLLRREVRSESRVLDVGCGNGYGVEEWRRSGLTAFGVDRSPYRLARWIEERSECPLVVADAGQLPFRTGEFDFAISSGMIEHVGVSEAAEPYTITPHPDRDERRQVVVSELSRVVAAEGAVFIDCPNGAFPVDFWHGDRLGAFRLHRVPDKLLPTHSDLLRWAGRAARRARLEPISGRLRFRQIGHRWWGRALRPLVSVVLSALDRLVSGRIGRLVAWLYPYIVVSYR